MAKKTKAVEQQYPVALAKGKGEELVHMLGYRRPSRKQTEAHYKEFLETYIEPVMGPHDGHYNYVHIVTADGGPVTETTVPRIAYMAHHDTVHNSCETQFNNLRYMDDKDGRTLMFVSSGYTEVPKTVKEKKWNPELKVLEEIEVEKLERVYDKGYSNCLGADCTAGVWLILEMIKAQVPGVYVIHNDEEIGRIGAELIVKKYSEVVDFIDNLVDFPIAKYRPAGVENGWAGLPFEEKVEALPHYFWIEYVDIAMSFDRKDYHSIITKQRGSRTASDSFAEMLSSILSPDLLAAGYPALKADPTGSFTDSASYDKLIKECTNLSVGYFDQHTSRETQDMTFIVALRDSLIKNGAAMNDPAILGATRDPNAVESYTFSYNYAGGYASYGTSYGNHKTSAGVDYLTYEMRKQVEAKFGFVRGDREPYYDYEQKLLKAYKQMKAEESAEKKSEEKEDKPPILQKETPQLEDLSKSNLTVAVTQNQSNSRNHQSNTGVLSGVDEEEDDAFVFGNRTSNVTWSEYMMEKYGITEDELADPDFQMDRRNSVTEEERLDREFIEKEFDHRQADMFQYDDDDSESVLDGNWSKVHDTIYDACMEEDTHMAFVDYAITLGATYDGLVNHVIQVMNDKEVKKKEAHYG